MKVTNFMLSILATFAIGVATAATTLPITTHPTSVIQVPADNGVKGGGLIINLPKNPTHTQADVLAIAYRTAKKDGHKHPELLQGILLQESKAGGLSSYKVAGQEFGLTVNKRYYGIGQLKVSAAKDVLNRYPSMWREFGFQTRTDEEIIAKLIENDAFNISIASKYLLILQSQGAGSSPQQLAAAYNQGVAGAEAGKGLGYSRAVMQHIARLN